MNRQVLKLNNIVDNISQVEIGIANAQTGNLGETVCAVPSSQSHDRHLDTSTRALVITMLNTMDHHLSYYVSTGI